MRIVAGALTTEPHPGKLTGGSRAPANVAIVFVGLSFLGAVIVSF